MKRNRKIGILLGILLCISLAAFGVSKYEERKEIIKNSDEVIMEVAPEEVRALSWECGTGSFAFHKNEGGSWVYDTDEDFPVDEEKIRGLLEQFQEFGVSFIIEEVEDFAQYGLDTPVCTIHMETESETYEIRLGDYSAMDSERYVSLGNGNAYLVKNDPLDQFEIEISDVIRHDEIPEFGDVAQMQFSGAESERIIYEEDSPSSYYAEDVYFMEQGEERMPLDTLRVDDYLDTIKNLSLKDYVTYHASEEELKEYGMDTPELTISLDYMPAGEETEYGATEDKATGGEAAGTFVLHIGRPLEEREEETIGEGAKESEEEGGEGEPEDAQEETAAYARVGDSSIIYRISGEQFRKLMDMSYDSLRHQEMFWGDFADMYQLDISLEGETYTVTSEMEEDGRNYYYQGEELEMANIRSTIRNLEAVAFTQEEPTQKEEASMTLYLDNENYPKISIQLYRYDGNRCLAVVDGSPVAFVERARAIDFVEAVHAIVLR